MPVELCADRRSRGARFTARWRAIRADAIERATENVEWLAPRAVVARSRPDVGERSRTGRAAPDIFALQRRGGRAENARRTTRAACRNPRASSLRSRVRVACLSHRLRAHEVGGRRSVRGWPSCATPPRRRRPGNAICSSGSSTRNARPSSTRSALGLSREVVEALRPLAIDTAQSRIAPRGARGRRRARSSWMRHFSSRRKG